MNDGAAKTDFYFGSRYRKSPFFEATRRAGCKSYGIYNHMYIPDYYGDPVEEYRSLTNDVTLWDVSVERIVEITGPDASVCTNRLTPRDLTKCAVGQGKYVLITAEDGGDLPPLTGSRCFVRETGHLGSQEKGTAYVQEAFFSGTDHRSPSRGGGASGPGSDGRRDLSSDRDIGTELLPLAS